MDLINTIHNRLCFSSPFAAIVGWTLSVFSYIHLDDVTVPVISMAIALLATAYGNIFDRSHFWRVISTIERKGLAIYYCAIGLHVPLCNVGYFEEERIRDVYRLSFTATLYLYGFSLYYNLFVNKNK